MKPASRVIAMLVLMYSVTIASGIYTGNSWGQQTGLWTAFIVLIGVILVSAARCYQLETGRWMVSRRAPVLLSWEVVWVHAVSGLTIVFVAGVLDLGPFAAEAKVAIIWVTSLICSWALGRNWNNFHWNRRATVHLQNEEFGSPIRTPS